MCKPMEKNKELRSKSLHVWSNGCQHHSMGKGQSLANSSGKTTYAHAEE